MTSERQKPPSRVGTRNIVVAYPAGMTDLVKLITQVLTNTTPRFDDETHQPLPHWSIQRLIGRAIDELLAKPLAPGLDLSRRLPTHEALFTREYVEDLNLREYGIFEASAIVLGSRDTDREMIAERVDRIMEPILRSIDGREAGTPTLDAIDLYAESGQDLAVLTGGARVARAAPAIPGADLFGSTPVEDEDDDIPRRRRATR